ncbi:hypothetical protein ACVZYT_001867 [Yersinia enterocolitica]
MHLPESLTCVSSSGCVYWLPTCSANDFGHTYVLEATAGLAVALARVNDCPLTLK